MGFPVTDEACAVRRRNVSLKKRKRAERLSSQKTVFREDIALEQKRAGWKCAVSVFYEHKIRVLEDAKYQFVCNAANLSLPKKSLESQVNCSTKHKASRALCSEYLALQTTSIELVCSASGE